MLANSTSLVCNGNTTEWKKCRNVFLEYCDWAEILRVFSANPNARCLPGFSRVFHWLLISCLSCVSLIWKSTSVVISSRWFFGFDFTTFHLSTRFHEWPQFSWQGKTTQERFCLCSYCLSETQDAIIFINCKGNCTVYLSFSRSVKTASFISELEKRKKGALLVIEKIPHVLPHREVCFSHFKDLKLCLTHFKGL